MQDKAGRAKKTDAQIIDDILLTNSERVKRLYGKVNYISGEGSIGERERVEISDFVLRVQWLPCAMLKNGFIKKLLKSGSVDNFIVKYLKEDISDVARDGVLKMFLRIRFKYDFAFWCAFLIYIKAKGGGNDVLFKLNSPQRKLVCLLEAMRLRGEPIRVILLKARQWGGSTCVQLYMMWLQLCHDIGLNSLIVGHVKNAAYEVKDMFEKALAAYPLEWLYALGESYALNSPKTKNVGSTGDIIKILQRKCKIKIGTAENPDSARGGDYNLVHCTEVGLWRRTEGKSPEDIIRSACSGVLYEPYTMIVYESTANGTGNFFHREYEAAKRGVSQFKPLFIAWYEIEQYRLDIAEERNYAEWLYKNKDNETSDERKESGKYLWSLWEKGATLEGIAWYEAERKKYRDHNDMAAEFPSDDVEAFVHSGAYVFDKYKVEELRTTCKEPRIKGDIYGRELQGSGCLDDLRISEEENGCLYVWNDREEDNISERITDRYLVCVDVGGRSDKADWSVIVVFDRLPLLDGDKPCVVAQWYGHIDMDLLAWKSAQIAKYYNNALLVIESNTLETKDRERNTDEGGGYILDVLRKEYNNLYARKRKSEDIKEGKPKKYGFHTNTETKPIIINNLITCVRDCSYVERDERCIDEYLTYERKSNGAYGAVSGSHDDLLMSRAIGLRICFFEMPLPQIINATQKTPYKRKGDITEAMI